MKEEFKWNTMRSGNEKTKWPKGTGHRNAIRAAVHGVGDGAIYSRESQTAVNKNGRQTEPLQIAVIWLSKSEIGGRQSCWRKCISTGGKGICRSSWRKWMRWCPRRLRVPSLNKIAQTAVWPSPLWEFRAANCFRDFIVAWQNENLRWSGLSYLSRVTGIQRSVAKGFCVSAFCPLECKRIRLASLRWFSDEANY